MYTEYRLECLLFICTSIFCLILALWSQYGHLYGFSPECVIMCLFNRYLRLIPKKFFLHITQDTCALAWDVEDERAARLDTEPSSEAFDEVTAEMRGSHNLELSWNINTGPKVKLVHFSLVFQVPLSINVSNCLYHQNSERWDLMMRMVKKYTLMV